MKFEQNWLRGFRGGRLKFSTIFLYKCIGNQILPFRKKVKRQRTTILLATLVDLPSPMIRAKIQPKASSVLEKKILKGF